MTLSIHVTCSCGSVLLWRKWKRLVSDFATDTCFHIIDYNRTNWQVSLQSSAVCVVSCELAKYVSYPFGYGYGQHKEAVCGRDEIWYFRLACLIIFISSCREVRSHWTFLLIPQLGVQHVLTRLCLQINSKLTMMKWRHRIYGHDRIAILWV